jgi:nanoRNase/pAp phosphatase (c-di-AMP/oligoRNAs hydrolase)
LDESPKQDFLSLAQKNRVVRRIIQALEDRNDFLLVAHENPDEDCIASMAAFGLLVRKFNKRAAVLVCSPIPDQFRFLLEICHYNAIEVRNSCPDTRSEFSTLVILDTPKPSMLEPDPELQRMLKDPKVLKIEIDHHLSSDSVFSGDPGYRLVSEASATCELIGYLGFKIEADKDLLHRHQMEELFTRNLVLAILTGILGDTKMGVYLKNRKERWYYKWFSDRFETLLKQKTFKGTGNFSSKEDVFQAIASLSEDESACYNYLRERERFAEHIRYAALSDAESAVMNHRFGPETVAGVSKALADHLAESSGFLGLVGYDDDPQVSPFVQFRLRRSQVFTQLDLRSVLETLGITNGGGHPGAVGFRFERLHVPDILALAQSLVDKIEALVVKALEEGSAEKTV